MLTRSLSLVGLVVLVLLAVIALPNWIRAFSDNVSPSAIVVSGLVVVTILAGAVMLMVLGVIGLKEKV
jgi:hypothetical protein